MYPDEYLNSDDEKTVKFFTLPFEPLSNWSAHTVEIYGRVFATLEHAFHYKKFADEHPDIAEHIALAESPWRATQIAHSHRDKESNDWHDVSVQIMEELIRAKFSQHEDVREIVAKTGDRLIIENSPVNSFWGAGKDGTGKNIVGKLWMKIRDE